MKTKLLIIYHIVTFITLLSFLSLFRGGIITNGFLFSIIPALLILFASLLLISASYNVTRVIHKKNMLRVSAILILILFISSIVARIIEITSGVFCISCFGVSTLYLILLIINILILKDL